MVSFFDCFSIMFPGSPASHLSFSFPLPFSNTLHHPSFSIAAVWAFTSRSRRCPLGGLGVACWRRAANFLEFGAGRWSARAMKCFIDICWPGSFTHQAYVGRGAANVARFFVGQKSSSGDKFFFRGTRICFATGSGADLPAGKLGVAFVTRRESSREMVSLLLGRISIAVATPSCR